MDPIWIKRYPPGVPAQIDTLGLGTVADFLDDAVNLYADRVAFVSGSTGVQISYTQLDQLSRRVAGYFQSVLKLPLGTRVALMMPNILQYPVCLFGLLRAGYVVVNINPQYTPRELEHQLKDSGALAMVIVDVFAHTLSQVIAKTQVQQVVCTGLADMMPALTRAVAQFVIHRVKKLVPAYDLPRSIGFRAMLKMGARAGFKAVRQDADELAFLQYTGGTTGVSKGAALTHRNLVANTEQFKALMPDALRAGQEVIVTAIPLYHIFALMVNFITYFSVGADNWLVTNPRDMDSFVDVLKKARPSIFMGVNTLYAGLTMHPKITEVDFSNLRLSGGGGSAVVAATSAKWKAITGNFIREGYGLSETSPVVSFNPASIQEFNGTTGLPLPGTDVLLLTEEGAQAGQGESGEVCVKGPQVMGGYWNQAQANAAAFTADGYFRTGDIGLFDPQGNLKIVDRKKDMVLVSGFNVFPNEIEAVASACPGVAECACVGVPDEKTGEAVKLFVVKTPGATLTEEEVIAHCRKDMTAYKVPKIVRFVDALPKSTVGKILRRELRDVA